MGYCWREGRARKLLKVHDTYPCFTTFVGQTSPSMYHVHQKLLYQSPKEREREAIVPNTQDPMAEADKNQPSSSQGQDSMAELRGKVRNLQSQLEVMRIALKHLKGFVPETKTYDELKTNAPRIEAKAPPNWSIYSEQAHQIMKTMNHESLSNQTLSGEEATALPFKVIATTVGCHKNEARSRLFLFTSNYERAKAMK
ncbi:hypothetical protein AMTRI_Chr01g107610 [Amborella trichopoda]